MVIVDMEHQAFQTGVGLVAGDTLGECGVIGNDKLGTGGRIIFYDGKLTGFQNRVLFEILRRTDKRNTVIRRT